MDFAFAGLCPLLQVFDMPVALRFYRDVLGFTIVDQAGGRGGGPDDWDWVWLRRDGIELMLNTLYDPDAPRPAAPESARVAGHGDTALFIGAPDVDAVYRHLQSHGIACDAPAVAPYGMKQLHLRDPDGYALCFQWKAG